MKTQKSQLNLDIRTLFGVGLTLLILLKPGILFSQDASKFYLRAPDVLPGTLPEMREPGFWMERIDNPDELILSLAEIQDMNKAFQNKMQFPGKLDPARREKIEGQLKYWPGLVTTVPDLSEKSQEELSETVQDILSREIKYLRKQKFGNVIGIEYADWEIDQFEKEISADRLPESPVIQNGITVGRAQLRIIPTMRPEHVGLMDNKKMRWDVWNLGSLPAGAPLQVIHVSGSGGFLFVLSDIGYGWIRSEKVAFGDKKKIEEYCHGENFIISTGEQVPYYSGPDCIYVSGWMGMGERLPLAAGDNPRLINVPTRNSDGTLAIQEAWLAKDADIHMGYLPYTRANVVDLTFKMMDLVYDWTGGWHGRNHVTILRDMFGCFGFKLPPNGEFLTMFHERAWSIDPGEGKDAQYQAMFSNESLITVQIARGHSQLYLGEYNGEPIVFDTHGYGYTDENGTEYEIKRSCIGNVSQPDYLLKNPIFFVELK
ncbi:SH3 domain-containing protein [Bacteroidota bacterium]